MKKKFILLFSLCLTTICQASVHQIQHDSTIIHGIMENSTILHPLTPTYHKNISEAANWGYNWFIEVKGGASAFLGSPLGCGDLFDRLKPTMQVGVGKWFTPAVGGRVEAPERCSGCGWWHFSVLPPHSWSPHSPRSTSSSITESGVEVRHFISPRVSNANGSEWHSLSRPSSEAESAAPLCRQMEWPMPSPIPSAFRQ